MASLRFRDLLRTKPQSLSIQGHILRGISWRAQTYVSGQSWGVCCPGVSTRPSKKHWAFRCLEIGESGIERTTLGQTMESRFSSPIMDRFHPFLITLLISSWPCFDWILCPMQLATTTTSLTRSGT